MTRIDAFLDAVNDRKPIRTDNLIELELTETGVKKVGEFLIARGYKTKRGSQWLICE